MKLNVKAIARAALYAAALVSSAVLVSCGGGETTNDFRASRVISFGDESSVITADQKKYTVNSFKADSTTQVDCTLAPIWNQVVANIYGLVFPQCPSTAVDPPSRIYATVGAQVADLSAQINQHLATGGFSSGDIVTVFVGVNDVIAQFQTYPTVGEDQLIANLDAAGTALANQVNLIAGLGAKVLVTTIPDVGLMPFSGDRSVNSTNSNPALLSRLSTRFNDALLANLLNDGHKIGLVQLDEFLRAIDTASRLGVGTFANTIAPACLTTAPLPNCTTATLTTNAVATTWLWADDRHLGQNGQSALGVLAAQRATNNPF